MCAMLSTADPEAFVLAFGTWGGRSRGLKLVVGNDEVHTTVHNVKSTLLHDEKTVGVLQRG